MKNLVIVSAIGKKRELGYKNDLVWKFKEDLQFFRSTTMGHYIVMGLRTYESLPPTLEGRKYIVISDTNIRVDGILTFGNIETFLKYAQNTNEVIYVIGGGMIYTQLLPYCDTMILTEIDAEGKADVFFPKFNKDDWNIEEGELQTSPEGIEYKRNTYRRRKR